MKGVTEAQIICFRLFDKKITINFLYSRQSFTLQRLI